jgi:hypothetical protein
LILPGKKSIFQAANRATSGNQIEKMRGSIRVFGNNTQGVLAESGITCGASTNVMNTVIHSNTPAGMEINTTTCKPDHSAFVGAGAAMMGTNNLELATCTDAQLFQDSANGNFVPKSGATCSLVDSGTPSHMFAATVTAPAYDLNGTTRPQGAQFDIGAYEAQ